MPVPRATRERHNRFYHHQAKKRSLCGRDVMPDALVDSGRRRRRKAARLLGDGAGPFARLWALPQGELFHVVVRYTHRINFYFDAPRVIKRSLARLFGIAPRYVRVALSRTECLHAHLLIRLQAIPEDWPTNAYESIHLIPVRDVSHVVALAEYFSRPHDERAARPKPTDLARFTREALATQLLDAGEGYLEARWWAGDKPLPALSWTSHLPRLKPDRMSLAAQVGLALSKEETKLLRHGDLKQKQADRPFRQYLRSAQSSMSTTEVRARAPPRCAGASEFICRLAAPHLPCSTRRPPPTYISQEVGFIRMEFM